MAECIEDRSQTSTYSHVSVASSRSPPQQAPARRSVAVVFEEDEQTKRAVSVIGDKKVSLKNWREIVQTFFGSCMSCIPFAAFSLTAGVYGADESMGSAALGVALALFKLGRLGSLALLNILPDADCATPKATPRRGSVPEGAVPESRMRRFLGPELSKPQHVSHIVAVVLGAGGAICTLSPQPALLCVGAFLIGMGWTDPMLQVHASENARGCKNVKVQFLNWIWKGRLLGMLTGSFFGGYLYGNFGWLPVVCLLAVPHVSYLVVGLAALYTVPAPGPEEVRPSTRKSALDRASRLSGQSTQVDIKLGSGGTLPKILVMLSACCVIEYTLAVMLSTMPLYFTTGLGSTETMDVFTFGIFDTSRVVLATIAVLMSSMCGRRCQRKEGGPRPVWIKLAILAPLYAFFVALPVTKDARLAMVGHIVSGVLYNLLGPILSAEFLCSLSESDVKAWVSVKTIAETVMSSLGSFYGPFALTNSGVATIFLVPTGLLLGIPVVERVVTCAFGKQSATADDDQKPGQPMQKEKSAKVIVKIGGVASEQTIECSSLPLLKPGDEPLDLVERYQHVSFWMNNNQAISCLSVAFSALGVAGIDASALVVLAGMQVHTALERPLTDLAVKTMLQHVFLMKESTLSFAHKSATRFDSVDSFEEYLKTHMTQCVVLINFSTHELEGLYGRIGGRSTAPREGWAIPVSITIDGLVQLLMFHGSAVSQVPPPGFVHLKTVPSALLLEKCKRLSSLTGRRHGLLVVGSRFSLPRHERSSWTISKLQSLSREGLFSGWHCWHQPEGASSPLAALALCLQWNCGAGHVTVEEVVGSSRVANIASALDGTLTLEMAHKSLTDSAHRLGLNLLVGKPFFADSGDGSMDPEFARQIRESIVAKFFVLVNFNPRVIHGDFGCAGLRGHFALAIACEHGEDSAEDTVLMLDPDPERFGRYWSCSMEKLWEACRDEDSSTGCSRGFLPAEIAQSGLFFPCQKDEPFVDMHPVFLDHDDCTELDENGATGVVLESLPAGWAAAKPKLSATASASTKASYSPTAALARARKAALTAKKLSARDNTVFDV